MLRIDQSGTASIAVIFELYSPFMLGSANGAVKGLHLTTNALAIAFVARGPRPGLRHQSEQGWPYASDDRHAWRLASGVTCRICGHGSGDDHTAAAAFFSTITSEIGECINCQNNATSNVVNGLQVLDYHWRHSDTGRVSAVVYERKMIRTV